MYVPTAGGATEDVLRPNVPELLFDDYLVDTTSGLTAVSHRAQRRQAIDVEQGGLDRRMCYQTGRSRTIRADARDELGTVIGEAMIGRYAAAHLAMFTVVDRTRDQMSAQYATSRDGLDWDRFFRTPLFDIGPVPTNEDAIISLDYPLVHGTRILFGRSSTPGQSESHEYWLRRDGWVSLDAGDHQGTLVTKVIRWPETDVLGEDPWFAVNICVRDRGNLVVRVLDEHGAPWSGREHRGACVSEPVTGDAVRQPVTWDRRRGIHGFGLAGQKVRLRFDMLDSSLFSFCLCTAAPTQ
jgi:hypothetical protein